SHVVQDAALNLRAYRRAGDRKIPGLSQGELNVSAMGWVKRDFDFGYNLVGSQNMALQPPIDPAVAREKIGDRGYLFSAGRGHMQLGIQGCQRNGCIRRMIGETKMAAHNAAVIPTIAAGQVAELATRFPTRESILQIPAPDILTDVSSQGAHIADLRRCHDSRRPGQEPISLPQFR